MRLVVRWLAVLLVVAALVALWLRFDSAPSPDAAGPRERSSVDGAAPQAERSVDESWSLVSSMGEPRTAADAATPSELPHVDGPSTALIRVRVVAEETGAPLAQESVEAQPLEDAAWLRSGEPPSFASVMAAKRTDAFGNVEFTIEACRVHTLFLSESPQRGSLEVPALDPGATHECELRIKALADVLFVGRVIDAQTQAVIGGAVISSVASPGRDGELEFDPLRSDDQGYFVVAVKSWTPRLLRVEASGYVWTVLRAERGHGTHSRAREIALLRPASAEITVLENDLALAGAQVTLATKSYHLQSRFGVGPSHYDDDPEWSATADASGVARFEALPPRAPFEIRVAGGGDLHVQRDAFTLEPAEARRLEVRLGQGVTLRGRLETSRGEAIADAEIWRLAAWTSWPFTLEPDMARFSFSDGVSKTRSDSDGRFTFERVHAGEWWVGAAPDDERERALRPAPIAQHVVVRGDEGVLDVVVRTDVGLYISGKVLPATDAPAWRLVSASNELLGSWALGIADTDGAFELGPLLRAEYLVRCGGGDGDAGVANDVTVFAGASDVALELRRGGSLRARVAPIGGELVDADLSLRGLSGHRAPTYVATEEGVRTFGALPPGVYDLRAKTANGYFALRSGIVVGAEGPAVDVVLQLERGARVEVLYRGPESRCGCALFLGETIVDWTSVERGTVGHLVSPAGAVELRCQERRESAPEVHAATLAPGERRAFVVGK